MHHYQGSIDWIERQQKSFTDDIATFKIFIKNNIGDINLHKTFPPHMKSSEKMVKVFEKSRQQIVKKATSLFTSGW